MTEASEQNFNSFYNSMWNMIITLTSAGYGDLFPKTFFGRLVGVVICFWGVLIISFFVVTVTNMIEFSPNEQRAYNLLMRLHKKAILKKRAVDVL
jgi:potassium voltage-gated channel Shab-related subfamily B member 1